jgi:hypothetical protein
MTAYGKRKKKRENVSTARIKANGVITLLIG